jgi:hypothetical protein
MERAVNYERAIRSDSWLMDASSIKRYYALSTYISNGGEFPKATQVFVSVLTTCKELVGPDDALTVVV